jgi:hypothetical protein
MEMIQNCKTARQNDKHVEKVHMQAGGYEEFESGHDRGFIFTWNLLYCDTGSAGNYLITDDSVDEHESSKAILSQVNRSKHTAYKT